jgi:fibronectin-binding autotransporter adhesin
VIVGNSITVNTGATLNLGAVCQLGYGNLANMTVTLNGGALTTANNTWNYIQNLVLQNGATVSLGSGGYTTGNGQIFDTRTLTSNGAGNTMNVITSAGGYLTPRGALTVAVDRGTAAADLSISAIIANGNAGTTSLTKTGDGILLLSGANTFTGNATISAGTVQMNSFAALGPDNNAKTITVGAGATLDMHGYVAAGGGGFFNTLNLGGTLLSTSGGGAYSFNTGWSQNWNVNLTGDATINIATSFGQLGAGYARTSLALNGNTLTKSGGGQYVLQNTDVGNGNINIIGGSIYLQSSGVSTTRGTVIQGTGTITIGDGVGSGILYLDPYQTAGLITRPIVLNGGNIRAVSGQAYVDSPINVAASTTSYADLDNAGANLNLYGTISGSGTLVIGNMVISGSTTLTGDPSGFNGTVSYVDNASGVNFRLWGASTNFSNATFLLSGSTTTTGRALMWQGTAGATLQMGALSGTGGVIGGGTTWGGSAFTLEVGALGTSTTFAGIIQDGSGVVGLTKIGTGILTLTAANTYSGTTTINAGTLQVGTGTTTGTLGSGPVVNNANLVFNRSDNVTLPGGLSGAGTLTQAGTGTLTITGAMSYSGPVNVNNGILQLGTGDAGGGGLSGPIANQTEIIVNRTDTITLGGPITGSGSITLIAGKLILAGDNSYTGSTTVNPGTTLLANNTTGSATGSSSLVIPENATLGGNGKITGDLTVAGNLSPGNSPGTLTVSNLTLTSSAYLTYELGATNASDLVVVTGNLTLVGTLNISMLPGFGVGQYTLFTYSGSLTTNGTPGILQLGTGYDTITYNHTIDISQTGLVLLDVTTVVVPEPETLALVGGSLLFLLVLRRRRQA